MTKNDFSRNGCRRSTKRLFIALLSGMLSQSLALSSATQNDLIASHAAELLIENAKSMSYEQWQNATYTQNQAVPLLVNAFSVNDSGPTNFRVIPVQLDLSQTDKVFGSVVPTSDTVNLANAWSQNSGNYFRGTAVETVTDATSIANSPAFQITVTITYQAVFGGSSKSMSRSAFVFQNYAHF